MERQPEYPPEYDAPTWPCGITQEGAERLQVQYARAVESGAETFFIDGKEISTEYAKHLLEYLKNKFNHQAILMDASGLFLELDDNDLENLKWI